MAVVASLLYIVQMGAVAPQNPPLVPGEVLARFAAGTRASAAVARAEQSDPVNLDALRQITDSLERAVSLPVRAVRLSAGGWVVLSLDGDILSRRLVERVEALEHVETAEAGQQEPQGRAGGVRPLTLRVRFTPGSRDAQSVAASRLAPVVQALEAALDVRLKAEGVARDTLVLVLDLQALTLSLVERLKALPEVEAVQPNYVLERFGTSR